MFDKENKRIIAKIEFKGPNLIKGIQFDGLRSLGNVRDFALKYYNENIDEIIFHDCTASLYNQKPKFELIEKYIENLFIPVTVGGGIRNLDDVKKMFDIGADKIAINTAAIHDPNIIFESARIFGSQSVVASVDLYREVINENEQDEFFITHLYTLNGKEKSYVNYKEYLKKISENGAGEILLNVINKDGTGYGCDIKLINEIKRLTNVPIIYSGGVGKIDHIKELFSKSKIDAVALSSVLHYFYYDKFKRQKQLSLRLNNNHDYGNYDFFHDGYGGQKFYNTDKLSIKEIKDKLFT